MRITITAPGGSPFLLADDTQPNCNGPSSNWLNGAPGLSDPDDGIKSELSLATQADDLINSPYKQELPRGNAQVTWTWKVQRIFDTQDNAAMFVTDHPPIVPVVGQLAAYFGTEPTVRYLNNAVLKGISTIEHKGLSVVLQYSYSGSFVAPVTGAAGSGTGGPFTTS
jgi:hypothetical protein